MHCVNNPRRVGDLTGPAHELYLVCPRCAWHAHRVQRQRPTQRGLLTACPRSYT